MGSRFAMAEEEDAAAPPERASKRSRQEDALALTVVPEGGAAEAPPRRRSLLDAPSVALEQGHGSVVTGVAFSCDGTRLASCSRDRSVGA